MLALGIPILNGNIFYHLEGAQIPAKPEKRVRVFMESWTFHVFLCRTSNGPNNRIFTTYLAIWLLCMEWLGCLSLHLFFRGRKGFCNKKSKYVSGRIVFLFKCENCIKCDMLSTAPHLTMLNYYFSLYLYLSLFQAGRTPCLFLFLFSPFLLVFLF